MNGRKLTIISIVLWSIVAIVVLSILANLILGGGFRGATFSTRHSGSLSAHEAGTFAAPGEDVTSIQIEWVGGDVTIKTSDEDTVRAVQLGPENLKEQDQMQVSLDNGTLTITGPEHRGWFLFGMRSYDQTSLSLTLPKKQLDRLRVETVSAEISCDALQVKEGNFQSVSGDIDLAGTFEALLLESTSGTIRGDGLTADSLTAETISGEIDLTGSFADLVTSTTSGDVNLQSDTPLRSFSSNSVSGDVSLTLPEENGFTLEISHVSGGFTSSLPVTSNGDRYVYGDGSAEFQADSVSGDLHIRTK
jgi:DUF4097 and DUF4098 domain-containing protein YvlB